MFDKVLIHIAAGLVLGVIISISYIIGGKKKYSKHFAVTAAVLPALVSVIIPLVGTDIAKAISLGGVFALVRFRSIPGDSRDIVYVFFTMAVGLAIGVDCLAVAIVITVVISVVFVLLEKLFRTGNAARQQVLRITVAEDMNFKNAFDDLFEKYLATCTLNNIKTSNMGTLFVISYDILPKKDIDTKKFIDELRTRNGNLNIVIGNPDEIAVPVL